MKLYIHELYIAFSQRNLGCIYSLKANNLIKSKDSIFDGKVAEIELGATQKVGKK